MKFPVPIVRLIIINCQLFVKCKVLLFNNQSACLLEIFHLNIHFVHHLVCNLLYHHAHIFVLFVFPRLHNQFLLPIVVFCDKECILFCLIILTRSFLYVIELEGNWQAIVRSPSMDLETTGKKHHVMTSRICSRVFRKILEQVKYIVLEAIVSE